MPRTKEKKRESGAERKIILFFFIVLVFIYSRIFVSTPMPVGHTVISLLVFALFTALYLAFFEPSLIKRLATWSGHPRSRLGYFFPLGLFFTSLFYAAVIGDLSVVFVLNAALYSFVPVLMVWFLGRQHVTYPWLETGVLVLLWIYLFGDYVAGTTIPPVQGKIQVLWLVLILSVLFAFHFIRPKGIEGLDFRLKGAAWRTVVHFTMIGILVVLIVGFAIQALEPATRIADIRTVLFGFVGFFFFVALPEEIYFRGICYRLVENYFRQRQYGQWLAVGSFALFYGLLHAWQANPVAIGTLSGPGQAGISPEHVVLAMCAGAVYTLVFSRTRSVVAAALTHALVGWSWAVFFSG